MADKAATKAQIRKAVVDAMETKDIPEITITEICNACNIARSTFYRYYDSIDDVIKKTGDELLASIERVSAVDRYDKREAGHILRPRQSDLARAEILYEYRPFILAVNGMHGDPSFAYKAVGTIRKGLKAEYGAYFENRPYAEFLMEFYLAGTFRSIDLWLRQYPDMSPAEFYGLLLEMYKSLEQLK
ncbi:TetR/AcrR family transcriptional regulator [Olsenella sp. AF16-14LB]|uniref:TetR/AcrR family transcriptional regulator n=1 Tax=unclassified Olsenella TaxID=2638792 RepID=UPI000E555859|nr:MULTISPECIES: TetR/AcrR family transcriptional regulator [unclassified Olsenella]RGU52536.1 TetR/AcrR family transcriptional regulator [Olsenella sp. AF16-14LB]RGU83778.1 TetR/AcrR family transcriptional regulator [Olsenella sp. AF15-43LB]